MAVETRGNEAEIRHGMAVDVHLSADACLVIHGWTWALGFAASLVGSWLRARARATHRVAIPATSIQYTCSFELIS